MIAGSFKFVAIIGGSTVDPIKALGDDRADEKASSAVLGFIGENTGQFPGEITDSYENKFDKYCLSAIHVSSY